ncbi:MAG TPA: DUF5996 family protein [Acidimicrobiia bacterium]|jgi:hypothetical protein|nr:DUF5996 family protein [Acidimicrobiia bacterium]
MSTTAFSAMPADFEPTRATLHAYAHAFGAIPRVHAIAHPKWWHISLNVRPNGLVTEAMALPSGGAAHLRMDLNAHHIALETSTGRQLHFSMTDGITGSEMGDALIAAVADLGLEGDYHREKFESDEAREYDPATAARFFAVLTDVHHALARHRATLEGDVGPLQVWPHGFDLAFEWFGTRTESYEEHGEMREHPSQINFGFYPGGDPYLYANPWPFDAAVLLETQLPAGAEWHTEGWQGTMLPYSEVAGRPDAAERILAYTKAVYEAAAPTLLV